MTVYVQSPAELMPRGQHRQQAWRHTKKHTPIAHAGQRQQCVHRQKLCARCCCRCCHPICPVRFHSVAPWQQKLLALRLLSGHISLAGPITQPQDTASPQYTLHTHTHEQPKGCQRMSDSRQKRGEAGQCRHTPSKDTPVMSREGERGGLGRTNRHTLTHTHRQWPAELQLLRPGARTSSSKPAGALRQQSQDAAVSAVCRCCICAGAALLAS